jgi:hypothetical protein
MDNIVDRNLAQLHRYIGGHGGGIILVLCDAATGAILQYGRAAEDVKPDAQKVRVVLPYSRSEGYIKLFSPNPSLHGDAGKILAETIRVWNDRRGHI